MEQVSLGLLSLYVDSKWRGSPGLVVLVFMASFDGRMDVSNCCLEFSSSNPRIEIDSLLLASSMICWIDGLGLLRSSWASMIRLTCLIFHLCDLDHDACLNWTGRGFVATSSSAPYWSYVGVLSSHAVRFHGQGYCRRKGNAGVILSGPPCTPTGGSYLLIPQRSSVVGVVCWTSEARDSVGRRLLLSRTFLCLLLEFIFTTWYIKSL